jgi:hypothetical protein
MWIHQPTGGFEDDALAEVQRDRNRSTHAAELRDFQDAVAGMFDAMNRGYQRCRMRRGLLLGRQAGGLRYEQLAMPARRAAAACAIDDPGFTAQITRTLRPTMFPNGASYTCSACGLCHASASAAT